ncbi:MAG: hypothetical protein ACLTDC_11810 [Lachnospiraceae bacterium]
MKDKASAGKELAKNTAIISIGKICTWSGKLFYSTQQNLHKYSFNRRRYGAVGLISIPYTALLLPLVTLQLEQALFRFLLDKRGNSSGIRDILSDVCSLSVLTILIFSIVFCALSPFIHSKYKFYLLLNLIVNAYSAMMLQVARGIGNDI